ncbi:hypothetical protein Tco_0527688 [Tanacetum coccineum]
MTLKKIVVRQLQIQQCKDQEVSIIGYQVQEMKQAVGLYQMKRFINRNWKHIIVTWQRFRRSHLKNPVLLSQPLEQVDQNAAECVDERAALANLTLDTEENKTVLKQLKKANASLTQELKECKTNLDESSRASEGWATSCRIVL